MTTTATPTTATSKVKALRIEINRAEGPSDKCGPRTFGTWEEANKYLMSVCLEKPKTGTYDKCDFKVTYEDGEVYSGRYDAAHPQAACHEGTLGDHIRHHLLFVTGLQKPGWMDQEKYDEILAGYRKEYPALIPDSERFLKGYALTDLNVTILKDEAPVNTAPTAPTTTTERKPSPEVRAEHLRIRDEQGLPPVKIAGNTYAVRRVLWTLGGDYIGDEKVWLLPAHTAAEGQRIVNEWNAKNAKKTTTPKPAPVQAAPVAKPAPVAAKPIPAPAVKPAPAAKPVQNKPTQTPGKLSPRLDALIKGVTLLREAATAEGNQSLIFTLGDVLNRLTNERDLMA